MTDRLRVVLVGVTAEDARDLGGRLDAGGLDVITVTTVAQIEAGGPGPEVEAVLVTPRAWQAIAAPSIDEDAPPLVEQLTARERDVLALVADGLSNRGIAAALEISEHTVKFHLASVFGKLGVASRTEAVRRGLQLGLIEI